MAAPLLLALPALKAMGAIAGKVALKAYFVGKMVGLKAFITAQLGAGAANVSVSILAAGCAAAVWQKRVLKNSDEAAVQAAAAKGMGMDVARVLVKWLNLNPIF